MLFNSYQFLIFFPIVVLLYFAFPQKVRWLWLLVSSYYFYMCWSVRYVVLLLFATAVSYLCGLILDRIKSKGFRKIVLVLGIIACLSVLFLFKYAGLIINSINNVLSAVNISFVLPTHEFMLPMGISFYTFQAIGYMIDVYRQDTRTEKNPLRYALFIAFFPQLVAGPIERSKNLLKQVNEPHVYNFERMREGLLTMLWGFFLKLVIADRAAVIVDKVYGEYEIYGGTYLIIATILFAIQIYCDFAGYSTIAVGAAEIMGFRLMENFNCPYLAQSVAEFWRRWHISLTTWFKDYLYIPLGGSRKGTLRKYINKMIVFLVSGLWHGAEWSFVLWGGLNGLYQVIGEILQPVRGKLKSVFHLHEAYMGHKLGRIVITFILVDFAWIFFRADTISDAFCIIKSIFTTYNPWIIVDESLYGLGLDIHNYNLLLFSIGILALADLLKYKCVCIRQIIVKQDLWFRWIFYLTALFFVVIFGWYGTEYGSSFIYFQF